MTESVNIKLGGKMVDIGVKYAECPYCGQKFHGYFDEEIVEKYNKHVCMHNRPEQEILEILERAINED